MGIFPLGKRVLIEPAAGELQGPGGLVVVDTSAKLVSGTVRGVGAGVSVDLRAGDIVLYWAPAGMEVKDSRGALVLIEQDSVWAKA